MTQNTIYCATLNIRPLFIKRHDSESEELINDWLLQNISPRESLYQEYVKNSCKKEAKITQDNYCRTV